MSMNFRLDLKSMDFSVKERLWMSLLLLVLIGSGCRRVVREEKVGESVEETVVSEAEYKAEMKKVMGLKLPHRTITIDKQHQLRIPGYYNFKLEREAPENYGEDKLGKLELAKVKDSIQVITLASTFSKALRLYDQTILIIPEADAKLITLKDIKSSYEDLETVYFQDENSIVFDEDNNFVAIHLEYDQAIKSYIYYRAEMSWTQKLPKDQKVNLFYHLIRNAKNLTSKSADNVQFSSWEDYARNLPVLEVNMALSVFKKLGKELKFFLDEGESVFPNADYVDHTFVELFRLDTPQQLHFQKQMDGVKVNKVSEFSNDYEQRNVIDVNNKGLFTIRQDGLCYIIGSRSMLGEGRFGPHSVQIVCPIDYNNKSFVLKSKIDDIGDTESDLFVKMFSYFAKHHTLSIKSK